MASLTIWLRIHRRRLIAALILVGGLCGAAQILGATNHLVLLPTFPLEPLNPSNVREKSNTSAGPLSRGGVSPHYDGSAFAHSQNPAHPVRIGSIATSSSRSNWLTYRYEDPRKGFEISFPSLGWRIHEIPTSFTDPSAELSAVGIVGSSSYSGVTVLLRDNDGRSINVEAEVQRAMQRQTPRPDAIDGRPTLVFDDVPTLYVDAGQAMLGSMLYLTGPDIVLKTIVRFEKPEPYPSSRFIDSTTTELILDSFLFLPQSE